MKKNKLTFILSDESVNSYGFRVLTAGIDLEQFQKKPVMLFDHCEGKVIGRWENIRVEGAQLKADAVFDENDTEAAAIKSKVENGFIKGASLGFNVIETSEDPELMAEGQTGATVTLCRAFEASIVAMPGNLSALYDAAGKRLYIDETTLVQLKLNNTMFIKNTGMKISVNTLTRLNLKPDSTAAELETAIGQLAQRAENAEKALEYFKAEQKVQLR